MGLSGPLMMQQSHHQAPAAAALATAAIRNCFWSWGRHGVSSHWASDSCAHTTCASSRPTFSWAGALSRALPEIHAATAYKNVAWLPVGKGG